MKSRLVHRYPLWLVTSLLSISVACRDGESSKAEKARTIYELPPEEMAVVPAGEYVVTAPHLAPGKSCTPELARELDALGSQPPTQSKQAVAAFAIDKKRVTCRDFRDCVRQHGCKANENERDCVEGDANVSRGQAIAYCAWRGHQLPTFLQWQAAARGPEGPRLVDPVCNPQEDPRVCQAQSPFGLVMPAHHATAWSDSEFTRTHDCFAAKWKFAGNTRPMLAAVVFLNLEEGAKLQLDLGTPEPEAHGDPYGPRYFFRCANDSTTPPSRRSKP